MNDEPLICRACFDELHCQGRTQGCECFCEHRVRQPLMTRRKWEKLEAMLQAMKLTLKIANQQSDTLIAHLDRIAKGQRPKARPL